MILGESLLLVGLYLSLVSTIRIYRIVFVDKSRVALDLDCGASVSFWLLAVMVNSFFALF